MAYFVVRIKTSKGLNHFYVSWLGTSKSGVTVLTTASQIKLKKLNYNLNWVW